MSTLVDPKPRVVIWLLFLPMLAWLGNALYAIGSPESWLRHYSPALVAAALITYVYLHGRMQFGGAALWRFVLIVFSIGWLFESLSVATGLPFGQYHYTEIMAPYLWHVPVFVLPAYALMGYASWSLAVLLLRKRGTNNKRMLLSVPLLAASAMVIWDLSMDPLRASLEGRWIWLEGGAHFGVPISNYFGWFVVTWCMFQCFAIYLNTRPAGWQPTSVRSRRYWLSVPLAYCAFSGEYLLNPLIGSQASQFVTINGAETPVSELYFTVAWICLFTMIPLGALGVISALRQTSERPMPSSESTEQDLSQ